MLSANKLGQFLLVFFIVLFCSPISFSSPLQDKKLPSKYAQYQARLSFLFSSDEKTLYILNGQGETTLYIINVESKKVLRKIPIGKTTANSPRSIVVTPDNKKIYVGSYCCILSIDPATGETKEIKTNRTNFMGAMAITHDGKTLFATEAPAYDNLDAKTGVYVVDIHSDTIISYIQKHTSVNYGFEDIALSRDESKLYLVEDGDHVLSSLDTKSLFLNEKIVDNENEWWPVAIIPNKYHRLYIPCFDNRSVFVVDDASYKIVNKISVGSNPWDGIIAANKLYISNLSSKDLSIIDTSNDKVIKTIPLGFNPTALRVSLDGKKVYVGNADAFSISIVDTSIDKVIDTWHFADILKHQQ